MLDSKLMSGVGFKTSLQKGAIFPIIIAIMVSLGLFLRSEYTGQVRHEMNAAQDAIVVVMEFNLATASLLSGDPAMNLKLWEAKYNLLKMFLAANESKGLLEHYAVIDVRNELDNVRSGLQNLVDRGFIGAKKPLNTDRFGNEGYLEIIRGLTTAMKSMMDSVSAEAAKSRNDMKMSENMANNMLLVFVGVFSMLMAGATVAYSQSAVGRLRRLKEVAVAAAEGDYSNRVSDLGANDEIGQTLRAFNAMVDKYNNAFGQVSGELNDIRKTSSDSKKVASAAREGNMRLADALTRLKRAQGQMVQQERLHALQQMGNGMTRDFNDALMPILSASDYLLSYPEHRQNEEDLLGNLKLINSAAAVAHTQVRRLAAVFNPQASVDVQCVDLKKIVERSLKMVESVRLELEREKSIKISCVVDLADVPTVQAVERDMEDAVRGILINAFESFTAGGRVSVSIKLDGDYVVMEVKDNGCGMSADLCRRSLEPFFSTKGDDHSGMGLTTALTAAGQYGGTVDVSSDESKGTTVVFRLPICTEDVRRASEKVAAASGDRYEILVVDDEEWILKIVKKCLETEGHNVDTALTGQEGLDKLAKGKFDLAILDWALPDMNGGELAKRIKELVPAVRMIILSGVGDVVVKEGLVPEGVKAVLSKPVTIDDLRDAVLKAMS